MFVNNFDKCGPIFKILSPIDLQENFLCIHHKDFHFVCNMLLHIEYSYALIGDWWKNFENWSTIVKVVIKHQVAYFFETQCINFDRQTNQQAYNNILRYNAMQLYFCKSRTNQIHLTIISL